MKNKIYTNLFCLKSLMILAVCFAALNLRAETVNKLSYSQNAMTKTSLNNRSETGESNSPVEVDQKRTVKGKVLDENGAPMIGVMVNVVGTSVATITDGTGAFAINADANSSLQVTYIGYEDTIVAADKDMVNIQMKADAIEVDEVVVVGYGVQKKVNLTGAVESVSNEVLENRSSTNISQSLVGAVPNLNITLTDGKPTQSPSFNVRGITSIGQGGSALILIDGVEGDPSMLNPNDIENISVLKDAASASIYGARAAFGVVLITTKSPEKGQISVTYSGNFAMKSPTTVPDNVVEPYTWAKNFSDAWSAWNDYTKTPTSVNKTLTFSPEYLAELEVRQNDPSLPRYTVKDNGAYEYYYGTDWYKELYKEQFFAQDHNLSVSGGNDKASFLVSARYNDQDGLFRYNTDTYNMMNLRAKGNVQITDWLKLDNNMEYSRMRYHNPINVGEGGGIWRNLADEGHPLAPLTNPDGSLSFTSAYGVGDFYLGKNYQDTDTRIFKNQTALEATIIKDEWTLRGDISFQNKDYNKEKKQVPVPYSRYEGVTSYTGANTNDLALTNSMTQYVVANFVSDYHKTINKHNFNVLLGYNYESSKYESVYTYQNGLVFEDASDLSLALGEKTTINGGYNRWVTAGGFFRFNYNFDERYLIEVNGRYDGSSRFPTDQQWAFFPSVSLGWRLSEEKFWNVSDKIMSNVKVRASYGSLGNGNISPYSYLEQLSISKDNRIINGALNYQTSKPAVLPEGLTWETSTTANIGLDFSMLKGRLSFTGDMYRRWTKDMYTAGVTLPSVFGANAPKGNYADLETTGWEMSLTWRDQFTMAGKPFNYDVRVSMADSYAIITKFNNPDQLLTDYYEGMKVGEIWGYQVEGLFESEDDIANHVPQYNLNVSSANRLLPGDIKFKDVDGDGEVSYGLNRVSDSGDKRVIGNSSARYQYGVNLGGDWNGFSLSVFFQGVLQQDYWPGTESRFWGQYNRPYNNFPAWHQENMYDPELNNTDAYLPRLRGYAVLGSARELGVASDRYLQNAAYIRLKNLQIGYTLPNNIVEKAGMKNLKVYMSFENLWTWSPMYRYTRDTDVASIYGSDRDLTSGSSGNGYNYPMLKQMSLGLSVNF